MVKYFCDKCDVGIDGYYSVCFGRDSATYGLCKQCDKMFYDWKQPDQSTADAIEQWMAAKQGCEDSTHNLLPLAEMAKQLLGSAGESLTLKIHCCTSCETDKWYETNEVTRYHLIKLQHAFIDYMEKQND